MGLMQYMVSPGNHEYSCEHTDCISYSQNFTYFNTKFKFPAVATESNMFYSFDYSNTHFVSISTETDYPDSWVFPFVLFPRKEMKLI